MRLPSRGGAGFFCGLMLVSGSLAPAPPDEPKAKLVALAKERIVLIRKVLAVTEQKQKAGGSTIEESLKWHRRLVDATRQAELPRAALVDAVRSTLKVAEQVEIRAKSGYEQGAMTIVEYLEVQDTLLQIKIELEQAEAK